MASPNSEYPATYQAPLFDRLKPALISAPIYVLAIFGRAHLSASSPIWLWIAATLGFVFLTAGFLSIGFCKVTLYPDRIEKHSFFGKKTMKRSEAGEIVKRQQGLRMLTYKYNSGYGIVLPKGIGGDDAWKNWLDYSKKI